MLIRSQDKKLLIDAVHLWVSDALGDKKAYVFARYAGQSEKSNQNTMGAYKTMAEALAQLDEISKFFQASPNGTYQLQ